MSACQLTACMSKAENQTRVVHIQLAECDLRRTVRYCSDWLVDVLMTETQSQIMTLVRSESSSVVFGIRTRSIEHVSQLLCRPRERALKHRHVLSFFWDTHTSEQSPLLYDYKYVIHWYGNLSNSSTFYCTAVHAVITLIPRHSPRA